MFYDQQPEEQRDGYKKMLGIMGQLSRMFSESSSPYLAYRNHENIFAKYFDVKHNARKDDSADAYGNQIGIGLKTWVGRNDQKVAEFGGLRMQYAHLDGMELVRQIAEYRNIRIRTTMNTHNLKEMLYHVVKRVPQGMQIYESAFDFIDTEHLVLDEGRGSENSIYFSDGKHTYHFSKSKNTLYMLFDDMILLDEFQVQILEDPYQTLAKGFEDVVLTPMTVKKKQLCLRLYAISPDGARYVPEKSGLNQWNAGGRVRGEDEIYIAYNRSDRDRDPAFFPRRDTPFVLELPDGTEMSAKVCQRAYQKLPKAKYLALSPEEKEMEDIKSGIGKSIMSNPNKALGKWLLRDVLNIEPGTLITYEMLQVFNIDSVVFTKLEEGRYSIDFCPLGTYESFYEKEE